MLCISEGWGKGFVGWKDKYRRIVVDENVWAVRVEW